MTDVPLLPWWLGGLALAGVMVGNWLLVGRMMAVSGRFTSLVDRALGRGESAPALTRAELAEAVRLATLAEFGEDALQAEPPATPAPEPSMPQAERPPLAHLVFLASLVLGGFLSAILGGGFEVAHELRGERFGAAFGTGWGPPLTLLGGGLLVGFGTRMASGCTSGHGLCGVSRAQPGSLVATVAFFGMGVVASFLIGGW